MSSVILAYLDETETASTVLAAAESLAQLAHATRINGLVVRLPPFETIAMTEEVLSQERAAFLRDHEHRRADALQAIFSRWAAPLPGRDITTEWFDIEARTEIAVKEHGSRVDAIVLKRPGDHQGDPERHALHAALFDTGRPVLVVPRHWSATGLGRRVAVAWRDDPRTLKAVLAALRWISHAEHIDVIEGVQAGQVEPHLPEIFEEHGVPATLHAFQLPSQGAFGAALLTEVHRLDADLLVMGAFAHNPLRNLILGGVTRHMLAHADLPVLLRH